MELYEKGAVPSMAPPGPGRAAGAADGLQGWHLGRNGCLVDGFINIAVDVIKSSMSRRYETIKQDY